MRIDCKGVGMDADPVDLLFLDDEDYWADDSWDAWGGGHSPAGS